MINYAIAKGWTISVHDGEDWAVQWSTDAKQVKAELAATDADTLVFRTDNGTTRVGSMSLVYGNEPGVVISDHTDNDAITALYDHAMKGVD